MLIYFFYLIPTDWSVLKNSLFKGAFTYVREIQCEKTIYRFGGSGACNRAWSGVLYQDDNGSFAQYQPAVCDPFNIAYRSMEASTGLVTTISTVSGLAPG